jgi:hypothetical protein
MRSERKKGMRELEHDDDISPFKSKKKMEKKAKLGEIPNHRVDQSKPSCNF